MKTLRFLITLMATVTAMSTMAQKTYTRVLSDADLYDGATCIITCSKNNEYYDWKWQQWATVSSDSILQPEHTAMYKTLDELAVHTTTFVIRHIDGANYLYDPLWKKFVSEVNKQYVANNTLWYLLRLTDQPQATGVLRMENEGAEVKIGNSYLRHHATTTYYRLVSKTNTSYNPVQMYIVRQSEPHLTLSLSTSEDLADTDFTGEVILNRTFLNNFLNTLILPFAVSNPQAVFGKETVCYCPQSNNGNTLTFRKMKAGEPLKANLPYLITGTFVAPPYHFYDTHVEYSTSQADPIQTVDGLTLHGVYQRQQMGRTSRLALYKQHFRSCRSVASLYIEPYKWFVETGEHNAKLQILPYL